MKHYNVEQIKLEIDEAQVEDGSVSCLESEVERGGSNEGEEPQGKQTMNEGGVPARSSNEEGSFATENDDARMTKA